MIRSAARPFVRSSLGFLLLLVLPACEPPPSDTFFLQPVRSADSVDIVKVPGGREVALSHKSQSDVSVFAVVRGAYIILWTRLENYSGRPAEFSPEQITATALDKKRKNKSLKVYVPGQEKKGKATDGPFKTLDADLAGVYQRLKGGAADPKWARLKEVWSEHAGEFRSIDQILLKRLTLGVNESAEGYIILQHEPGANYTITIPAAGAVHRFDFVPVRKEKN